MKLLKKIQQHWITFWLIASVILLSAVGSVYIYSAYMGNSEMKRTISTRSISDIVFSSNVLKAPAQPKNLHDSDSTKEYEYPVTVCNFEQMSPATHAKEQIVYDLTAELVRYDGTNYVPVTETVCREDGVTPKVFQIKKTGDDNVLLTQYTSYDLNSGTFKKEFKSETLSETASVTDTFTIVFDREEMTKAESEYFIQVTATPAANTVVSGTVLEIKAYINVSKGKDYGSKWGGVLLEADNADYDAYNMQLTGAGSGTIEIMWKTDYFTISDMFLMDSTNEFVNANGTAVTGDNAIIKSGEWSKVILKVDSYTKVNKYDIQFFKMQSHTYTESDPISGYIKTGEYVEAT